VPDAASDHPADLAEERSPTIHSQVPFANSRGS
jgi:hypothetical protein